MNRIFAIILAVAAFGVSVSAQTNEFNYQGSLNFNGIPANGSFDFEFRLFGSESGGTQIGGTVTRTAVSVVNGSFGVTLSIPMLGPVSAFSGPDRWIEIAVRQNGSGSGFQQLSPRSKVTSAPYSIQSLTSANSERLGGIPFDQFVTTTDPRLSDARAPLPNSNNYIINSQTTQVSANFKIGGIGSAGAFDARVYRLDGVETLRTAGTDDSTLILGQNLEFCAPCTGNSIFGIDVRLPASGNNNSAFGFQSGPRTPDTNATLENNSYFGYRSGYFSDGGSNNTFIGANTDQNGPAPLIFATAIGAGAVVDTSNTIVLGRSGGSDTVRVPGQLRVITLGSAGAQSICRNLSGEISTCSSSIRYKSNVSDFSPGLTLIRRLRPVSFVWTEGGMSDLGLIAEEVAEIDPLLVTRNQKGEVEGVKYDRVGVIAVNAIKEQQVTIERQQAEIESLRAELAELRKAVCSINPGSKICAKEIRSNDSKNEDDQ